MITSKDFKRKLTVLGGQKKTKACLNLELITGKEGSLLTNILYRNCAEKNQTVVRKILEVKESFESLRVHWSQERRDKVRKMYMYWRRNSQQQTTFRSVWWSTSTASALFNDFHRWKGILNCFSVDEKCGDSCWESRADFQSKTSCNCCFEALNLLRFSITRGL